MTRIGASITTYTGRRFYPFDIREGDVNIMDIAHALSMLCRFGGHCRRFYSVAEHSVHVSLRCPTHPLIGLLHDATEAYLVDVPRPIKRALTEYEVMERDVWAGIARHFSLPVELPEEVTRADDALLKEELVRMMAGHEDDSMVTPHFSCWDPDRAEAAFLARFAELRSKQMEGK